MTKTAKSAAIKDSERLRNQMPFVQTSMVFATKLVEEEMSVELGMI